jgi:hypothetical protein
MPSCFLCHDDDSRDPVLKVCLCDTRVHASCFLRLVRVPSHSEGCAVCKQPYLLLRRTRCRVDPFRACAWCTGALAWLFLCGVCALVLELDPSSRPVYVVLLLGILASGAVFAACSSTSPSTRFLTPVSHVVGVRECVPSPHGSTSDA